MSDSYIIEVNSQAAGIVVRNTEGGYCFFASSQQFDALEGRVFRNAREAEHAARRLINGGAKAAVQAFLPLAMPRAH